MGDLLPSQFSAQSALSSRTLIVFAALAVLLGALGIAYPTRVPPLVAMLCAWLYLVSTVPSSSVAIASPVRRDRCGAISMARSEATARSAHLAWRNVSQSCSASSCSIRLRVRSFNTHVSPIPAMIATTRATHEKRDSHFSAARPR